MILQHRDGRLVIVLDAAQLVAVRGVPGGFAYLPDRLPVCLDGRKLAPDQRGYLLALVNRLIGELGLASAALAAPGDADRPRPARRLMDRMRQLLQDLGRKPSVP